MSFQDSPQRKLVIVEQKLVRNRGHQHTQIGALRNMLPGFDLHLITGEDYNGFLGEATARTSKRSRDLSKLYWRTRHGSARQKIDAALRALVAGQILSLPGSSYGHVLAKTCDALQMSSDDLVIVPSADLESLESTCWFVENKQGQTPRLLLRFLDPELGEHKGFRRKERLKVLSKTLAAANNLVLSCETEEMAAYLNAQYGLDVKGGFYLPCSFDPADPPIQPERPISDAFRIGLFGAPRPGKGYERIGAIVSCIEDRLKTAPQERPIEILLQGAEENYVDGGVYAFADKYKADEGILRILKLSDRLDPSEFTDRFLSTDAILLPYDTAVYGLQGSGIIQDAVAAEKFVIHSEGISMQNLLNSGNALAASSDSGFAEAICEAAMSRGESHHNRRAAREKYLASLGNNFLIGADAQV
ncbi:hypothetical protein [uncultured Roseibium sp.]|uniref:hypothetical protein n=1 Tax=uncultured Roseibium sp. TaxID=1936171 RepID=UPI002603B28D|nr:hypothetical protein [uncultured Roseibium sp.]